MRQMYINNETEKQLITQYKNGNIKSFNILYNKYFLLSKKMAKQMFQTLCLPGLTEDDIAITGVEAFYYSCSTFNPEQSTSFYHYWKKTFYNEISHIIRENERFYKNAIFSLDEYINRYDGLTYGEVYTCEKGEFDYDIDNEKIAIAFNEEDVGVLSDMEKQVIARRMFGDTYEAIAKRFESTQGKVRRIYMKGIKKLQTYLNVNKNKK